MVTQNQSIIPVMPCIYRHGFLITNDVTTPNTVLSIAAGQCRDSQNMIDMGVGTLFPPPSQASVVSAPLSLNAAVTGANGLDVGSLAASTMYAVYIIGDSSYSNSVASLLSLASNSIPTLPFGYDSYRLIGYWPTGGSSTFLLGYYTGTQGSLIFKYDAPQATAITAGAATTYTAITLTSLVPNVNNCLANIQYAFTPGAASRTLKLQGANATGDAITVVGQVTSVVIEGYVDVDAQLVSGLPKINYKVSNSGDAVAINVAGFTVSV